MTDKLRYLLMYEQQMLFVAHKTQYMSNKWICGAQMHNKFVCWTKNGKYVRQFNLSATDVQQICLLDIKWKI